MAAVAILGSTPWRFGRLPRDADGPGALRAVDLRALERGFDFAAAVRDGGVAVRRVREDALAEAPRRGGDFFAFADARFCVRAAAMSAQSVVRQGQRPCVQRGAPLCRDDSTAGQH